MVPQGLADDGQFGGRGGQETRAEVIDLARVHGNEGQAGVEVVSTIRLGVRDQVRQQRVSPAAIPSQLGDDVGHLGDLDRGQLIYQVGGIQGAVPLPGSPQEQDSQEEQTGHRAQIMPGRLPHHLPLRRVPVTSARTE